MPKFLAELSDSEEETYFAMSTLVERLSDYKQTCVEIYALLKNKRQSFENYIVPERAILDRMGQKPKGR